MRPPYEVIAVDITTGSNPSPEFAALNPNRKIPVIVDHDGPDGRPMVLIESGAILVYLAEKSGHSCPRDPRSRSEVLQWLMFQMGKCRPDAWPGSIIFLRRRRKKPYAIARYDAEARRIYAVLESRLQGATGSPATTTASPTLHAFPDRTPEWQHRSRRLPTGQTLVPYSPRVQPCKKAWRCQHERKVSSVK